MRRKEYVVWAIGKDRNFDVSDRTIVTIWFKTFKLLKIVLRVCKGREWSLRILISLNPMHC